MIDTISKGLKRLIAENKALRDRVEELEKDRVRLEWFVRHGAQLVTRSDPAEDYAISYAEINDYPHWRQTSFHESWRDAIDEAMSQ